jgi:hypothetical protein
MGTLQQTEETSTAGDTLHDLANALASARMWLTVATHAPPTAREGLVADALVKLRAAIDDAQGQCHRLREAMLREPRPRAVPHAPKASRKGA